MDGDTQVWRNGIVVERISHGTHIHNTHVHAFSMGNTFVVSAFGRYWLELCKIQKDFMTFFDDFEWDLGTWVGDIRT
jgi:hypothetical protein